MAANPLIVRQQMALKVPEPFLERDKLLAGTTFFDTTHKMNHEAMPTNLATCVHGIHLYLSASGVGTGYKRWTEPQTPGETP